MRKSQNFKFSPLGFLLGISTNTYYARTSSSLNHLLISLGHQYKLKYSKINPINLSKQEISHPIKIQSQIEEMINSRVQQLPN